MLQVIFRSDLALILLYFIGDSKKWHFCSLNTKKYLWMLQHKAARCHRYRRVIMFQFKVTMWSVIDDSMSFLFWSGLGCCCCQRLRTVNTEESNAPYQVGYCQSYGGLDLVYRGSSRKAFLTDRWGNPSGLKETFCWNLLVQVIFPAE